VRRITRQTERGHEDLEVHEMRRVLVLAAMAALIIGTIPSVAGAARADRFTEDGLGMACLLQSEEQGTVYMESQVTAEYGGFAGLYWWEPGLEPFSDLPTLISGENTVTASVEGNSMDASMELYVFVDDPEGNNYGDPAGQATLSAIFELKGEPIYYSDRSHGSNAQFRYESVQQPLTATGSLTLPSATYDDLSECQAVREHVTFFATNPDTFIERSDGIGLTCEWTDADRSVLLFANTERSSETYSELIVTDASGEYFSSGDASLTTEAFSAAWELRSPGGGGDIVPAAVDGEIFGSATASATLTPTGEGDRIIDRSHDQMTKFTYEILAVSGELSVTTQLGTANLAMDGEHCTANTADVLARFSSPHAAGGRPLANDLPGDAEPIDIGQSVSVSTAGTDTEPEAPCLIDEEGGQFEIPFGHTAWWTMAGTGGDVTVDTAGSDFDTVVGVYVLQGEELVQVGCVDDVFVEEEGGTLQARLTVATEAEVTYLIQAGGYGGSTGQLELSLQ
jgi:hypothetical protein